MRTHAWSSSSVWYKRELYVGSVCGTALPVLTTVAAAAAKLDAPIDCKLCLKALTPRCPTCDKIVQEGGIRNDAGKRWHLGCIMRSEAYHEEQGR